MRLRQFSDDTRHQVILMRAGAARDNLKQHAWMSLMVVMGLAILAYIAWRPPASPVAQTPQPRPTTRPVDILAIEPAPPGAPLTSASGPDDWAMEGSNPGRTRAIATAMTLPLNQQRELKIVGDQGYGSPPTIAGGLLLVESQDHLQALDLQSGKPRWAFPQVGAYLSPAVAGTSVFIRVESDNKGQILALDLQSGKPRWAFTPRRLSNARTNYFGGHLTSPVVVDGLVFVGAGQEVYALDAQSGAVRWEFVTEDLITSSASVEGGRVYISDFGHFYAIDQRSGGLAWSYPTTSSIYFSAVAAGPTVLLADGDRLTALEAASGRARWSLNIPGEGLIPAAISGSRAFVKSTSTLYALDLASGKELWRFHDPNFVSLPVIADQQIFAVSGMEQGTALIALDAATGRGQWRQPVAALSASAPVIAGQTIYVRTTDGRVLGFWH